MLRDLLFANARVLDPATGFDASGALLVRDGVILDHGANLGRPDGAEVIDATGLILAPGLIDLRAAIGEHPTPRIDNDRVAEAHALGKGVEQVAGEGVGVVHQ